jgi:hypothetical protein
LFFSGPWIGWKKAQDLGPYVNAVEAFKKEKWEDFKERQGDWGRDVVLCLARRHSGMTLPAIAKAAGISNYYAVGKAVSRMEKRVKADTQIGKIIRQIERKVSNVRI